MIRAGNELPVGRSLLRIGLTGVTGVLAILAVVCSLLAWRYQTEMIVASRYNGTFDFSQTGVELLRFQLAFEAAWAGAEGERLDLRYAILVNRLGIIEESSLLTAEDRATFLNELKLTLDAIGPRLADRADLGVLKPLVERLTPSVRQVLRIASRAQAESGDTVLENQQLLQRVLFGICAVTLTLVFVGAALIVLVLRQHRRLDSLARTDALTGLANRLAFNLALRSSSGRSAIVLVDLDHFKSVNDTLGHEAGDQLLCTVAARLRATLPPTATLARVGGDEFAVLFPGQRAGEESEAFCARVQDVVGRPVLVGEHEVFPSVTQGLCVADGGDRSALLNDADIALYAAKVAGRGRYMVFEPSMKRDFLRRQRLLEDMRQAVERGEFFLLYQPIVDLRDGRPRGFEALLRWQHPELGLVSPAEFIPIAEEGGLIQALGHWVIEEACRQAAAWPRAMFVAVNVSARQLTDLALVEHLSRCLATHGIAEGRLEIEITESALVDKDGIALTVLGRIQALGCRISLDDFGTGYASLSYLRRFRFDKIKIDQSFVRENALERESAAIVAMVCALANRLGLTIVAEGIETQEQRAIVREAGGHLGQGYLFHRPLTPAAVRDLVGEGYERRLSA